MKLFIVLVAAFASTAAALGQCCAPGCTYCKNESCGEIGDNDCSNNSVYTTCCDDSRKLAPRHAREFLRRGVDAETSKTE